MIRLGGVQALLWRAEHCRHVGQAGTPTRDDGGRSSNTQGNLVRPVLWQRLERGQEVVPEIQDFWEPPRTEPGLGIVLPCFSPYIATAAAADAAGAPVRLAQAAGKVWPLTHLFVFKKIIDLPGWQINDLLSGEHLGKSVVPPSNSLVSFVDP